MTIITKTCSNYVKDAEIKASHILVKLPNKATPEEKKALKEKAEKILVRVRDKKEDFASVAKTESEDVGTKANGGDLGFFSAGKMVEEIFQSSLCLKTGRNQ